MAKNYEITVDGRSFPARSGELLLDAALRSGVDLPFNCRAGHCGTCCVKLLSGKTRGGNGALPGVIHTCQSRVGGDAVIEKIQSSRVRTVDGVLREVRAVTSEVMEVSITVDRAFPYHPGQYTQVKFRGFPSRSFSITHPLVSHPNDSSIWLHVRRMPDGHVTLALGNHIRPGHPVQLTGPYGSAYYRPNQTNRMLLVATSTGFAPIWSIASAALRENPNRAIMVIAGGRSLESLYMASALEQLAKFPNVRIVPVCSAPERHFEAVRTGRPTNFLPRLLPTDVVYACGAPAMVDAIKSFAADCGAPCYADPFLPATDNRREAQVARTTVQSATLAGRHPRTPNRTGRARSHPAEQVRRVELL